MRNATIRPDCLTQAINDPACLERAHDLLSQVAFAHPDEAHENLIDEQFGEFNSERIAALGRLAHTRTQPCLVFNERGDILVANAQADALFGARPGLKLEKLAIKDAEKTAMRLQLKAIFGAEAVQQSQVMRIYSTRQSRAYTIVLAPPNSGIGGSKCSVAHVVDLIGVAAFRHHISQKYELTRSESAVLEQFMSGETLEQIAKTRRRSLATVKKQFYALIAKFNVKSQTELLQLLFALTQVFEDAGVTDGANPHPNRQEATVLRPHGRVVEVILAGDMSGSPVVVLPTLFQRCFPARIEQQFRDAGILLITVVPPGRGKTSGPRYGTCERASWADDIAAVLDQLSIDSAMVFGTDDMLRMAVLIAKQIPHRLNHILVTAPVLPMSYEQASNHRHNLIPFSKKMQHLKPSLRKLSLRLFWRSLTLLQAKGMSHIFLRNDPNDLRTCHEPDALAELQAAFDSVLAAGFERGANHHLSTFDDWQTHINDCPVPITLYEGSQSRLCSRDMLDQFVADHANAITLVEFETAGTSFPYIRPDLMIKMVKSCRPDGIEAAESRLRVPA